jgi:hypothetical protein
MIGADGEKRVVRESGKERRSNEMVRMKEGNCERDSQTNNSPTTVLCPSPSLLLVLMFFSFVT